MEACKHLPHFGARLAEVGELNLFLRGAPHGLGGEVQVAALQEVQLPGPEHEIKGQVGSGCEVIVDCGQEGQVRGVVPLLPGGLRGTAVVASGDGVAQGYVTGWKEVKLVGQAKS